MPAVSIVGRLLATATRVSLYASAALLMLLLCSYVFEVIMRYFFSAPTTWTFDLGKALLCTSVVLALPEITRTHENVTIDVLVETLPRDIQQRVKQLIFFLCFIVCMLAFWICLNETQRQFGANIETYWNNPIPKWWISAFIPFGFALSGLHFLRHGLGFSNKP